MSRMVKTPCACANYSNQDQRMPSLIWRCWGIKKIVDQDARTKDMIGL